MRKNLIYRKSQPTISLSCITCHTVSLIKYLSFFFYRLDGASCKNIHNDQDCESWARSGECDKNPSWMKPNCKKSCKICSGSGGTDGGGSKPGVLRHLSFFNNNNKSSVIYFSLPSTNCGCTKIKQQGKVFVNGQECGTTFKRILVIRNLASFCASVVFSRTEKLFLNIREIASCAEVSPVT